MRKSNIIIVVILVAASLIFLWLWNYLNFNLIDPVDLIITIVWWVIILGICIAIHRAEQKRRERIRTIFISDGMLYNSEAGTVRVNGTDATAYIDAMRLVLNNLRYGSDVKPDNNQNRVRFKYIVHSVKFADSGNTWTGDVIQLPGTRNTHTFNNVEELKMILSAEDL